MTELDKKAIEILNDKGNISLELNNDKADYEMLLYGKKIESNLSNYYLFLNTFL